MTIARIRPRTEDGTPTLPRELTADPETNTLYINGMVVNQGLSGVSAYVSTPAPTTLTDQSTWYALGGTFSHDILENFTFVAGPPPGIEYNGAESKFFKIDFSGTVAGDQDDIDIEIGVAINGTTPDVATIMGARLAVSGDNYNISGVCALQLSTDDVVTIVARCTSNADRTITANYFTTTLTAF